MTLRPGQRVGVTIPLRTPSDSRAIPWPAVLHDIHGGTWVYEQIQPHTFRRTRVQVRYVVDGVAAVAQGPEPGAEIVTAGAAELFGTEFGTGK